MLKAILKSNTCYIHVHNFLNLQNYLLPALSKHYKKTKGFSNLLWVYKEKCHL